MTSNDAKPRFQGRSYSTFSISETVEDGDKFCQSAVLGLGAVSVLRTEQRRRRAGGGHGVVLHRPPATSRLPATLPLRQRHCTGPLHATSLHLANADNQLPGSAGNVTFPGHRYRTGRTARGRHRVKVIVRVTVEVKVGVMTFAMATLRYGGPESYQPAKTNIRQDKDPPRGVLVSAFFVGQLGPGPRVVRRLTSGVPVFKPSTPDLCLGGPESRQEPVRYCFRSHAFVTLCITL